MQRPIDFVAEVVEKDGRALCEDSMVGTLSVATAEFVNSEGRFFRVRVEQFDPYQDDD